MRLGILGGTFDPIHFGHLRAADEVGEELELDRVCLIPAASPPHKSLEPLTPFPQRLHMARLAVSDAPRLEVLDLEGRRPGLSYSIETLRELRRLYRPEPELFFILGMDAFLEIETWKHHLQLFDEAHFVVLLRPGSPTVDLPAFFARLGLRTRSAADPGTYVTARGKRLLFLTPTLLDISSTGIRARLGQGRSIRFLVPETVRHYIHEEKIYAIAVQP